MDLHTCMHAHTAWSVTQFYMKQNVSCNKGFSLDGSALPKALDWWWMLGWCHQQAPPVLWVQTVLNLSITSSKFVCISHTHTHFIQFGQHMVLMSQCFVGPYSSKEKKRELLPALDTVHLGLHPSASLFIQTSIFLCTAIFARPSGQNY